MTAKKGRPQQKKMISFSTESTETERMNAESTLTAMRQMLGSNPDVMQKSVKAQAVRSDVKEKYDKSKVVFSTKEWSQVSDNIWTKGWRRVSDPEQRELAQIDPYLSAIISTRCSQGAACGYPSESKFDKGCRVVDLKPPSPDDFATEEEFAREVETRTRQQSAIMHWVLHCGTNDQEIVNSVFSGGDLTFKNCSLREFIEAQARNVMTFGRCASQIFRNADGLPVMFRPAPVETIFNVVTGEDTRVGVGPDVMEQSATDVEEYNQIKKDEKPLAYVQRVDGNNINFFSEDDLHVWHWQKQALWNLNGYPMSPIEQAVYMIFIHQQTLSYLRNQFVKGLAAKGLLCLESTNPAVELSESDLEDFRIQFHNFATRNDNSAVMPVLSGPVKANFIQLSSTPRDMEFLQVEEHVIRALCSAFQISPQEMGYGHLSQPQGGLTSGSKQEEIVRGEERGLRQLLDTVFDGINQILYQNFPEARDNFRISYVGVGEDTRDAVVQRQTAELATTATMESLYADSEKKDTIPAGGKVPLSQAFHQNVVRYMKYGEFVEKFMGEEGASKNPAYDFIIDPNLNSAYQQLRATPIQQQQEQSQLQLKAQEQEMEMQQAQMQQGQQQAQQGAPAEGQPQGQPQEGQPQGQEMDKSEEPVSIRDKWHEAQSLRKSMTGYFGAWIDAHGKSNE
jgi:hypothetical protein